MRQAEQKLLSVQRQSQGFLGELQILDIGSASAIALTAEFNRQFFRDSLFAVLGVARPEKLDNAISKRRAEFLAGRTVSKAALFLLGKRSDQVPISPDREPIWPKGVVGSITHSNGRCAAVVSDNTSMLVGIDIEDVASASSLDTIFQEVLLPDEANFIRSQNVLPPEVLATLVFSAKETLYKALFPKVRRFFGFDHAKLDGLAPESGLRLRLTKPLDGYLGNGTAFDVHYSVTGDTITTWLFTSEPGGQDLVACRNAATPKGTTLL